MNAFFATQPLYAVQAAGGQQEAKAAHKTEKTHTELIRSR